MREKIRHLPARLLTPDERALFNEWFAAVGDIASAYVSNRAGDDPALHHRIVIVTTAADGPSHFVYASAGRNIWIVVSSGQRTRIKRFRTLRAALTFVRPVLVGAQAENVFDEAKPLRAPHNRARTRAKALSTPTTPSPLRPFAP